MKDFLIVAGVWNAIVFAMYGIDKLRAIKGQWRISERTLLLSCFLMGGAGGIAGMYIWRHKTRHWKFRILVPLSVICNAAVLYMMYKYIFMGV